jgi:hypothetical protein
MKICIVGRLIRNAKFKGGSLDENAESSGDIPRLGHYTKLLRVLPDWLKTG